MWTLGKQQSCVSHLMIDLVKCLAYNKHIYGVYM